MDDLISRQQAIAAIEGADWYTQNKNKDMVQGAHGREDAWYKAQDVYKVLEDLPPAQPEIVRCKDCKWHEGRYRCLNFDVFGFDYNDYCSLAERRENE